MHINVTLGAYEGDDWPNADELYEDYIREQLAERYPTAKLDVSSAQGRTQVYVDGEPDEDLRQLCSTVWWDEFCAAGQPVADERTSEPHDDGAPDPDLGYDPDEE